GCQYFDARVFAFCDQVPGPFGFMSLNHRLSQGNNLTFSPSTIKSQPSDQLSRLDFNNPNPSIPGDLTTSIHWSFACLHSLLILCSNKQPLFFILSPECSLYVGQSYFENDDST
ncbi:hypothetical protein AMECASPLE_011993, partial [Ameca splendens]